MTAESTPAFRAVILDLDGTLIDSNWLHLRSWRIALERLGLEVPDQKIVDRLGLRTLDIARDLVSSHGENAVARLAELKMQLFEEAWRREVKSRRGALEILRMIRAGGLRSAVASSNAAERILNTLRHFGMERLVDSVVGIDEVQEGKPNPALVTVAMRKLAVGPNQTIYVGDSKYDIEAGRAAGARTALIVQPIAAQSNLRSRPDYAVRELAELQAIIWPKGRM